MPETHAGCPAEQLRSIDRLRHRWRCARSKSNAMTCGEDREKEESYADAMNHIRTKVVFALFRRSILCLRGCRSMKEGATKRFNWSDH